MIKIILRLIKCHYNFCFTKKTYLLIFTIFAISLIYNLVTFVALIDSSSSISIYKTYVESSLSFLTLLITFFVNIMFAYSFISKQDSYLSYLITNKINRTNYFFTKIITIILLLLFFILLEIISFFFPFLFYKYL